MKLLSTLFICLFVSSFGFAQMSDSIKVQYIKDWQRAKLYTKEYLDAMPKDKYNFRAQDSIRTFGQQMLHLAQGNVGLISNGTGSQRLSWAGRNLERSEGAQSADSVIYFVMSSYDFAIESISNMDANKLWERFGRGNFNEMRFTWLNKAFEHQTHHRGQTTVYIRLLGIKPPNEKLF